MAFNQRIKLIDLKSERPTARLACERLRKSADRAIEADFDCKNRSKRRGDKARKQMLGAL